MSIDSSSSLSSSRHTPALPQFLCPATSKENAAAPERYDDSKLTVNKLRRALYSIFLSKRLGTVDCSEKLAGAAVEDENDAAMGRQSVSSRSAKLKRSGPPVSPRPSLASIRSQSTFDHRSTFPHSPHTLITSFPSLKVSDISPKSPTNESPFSAVLLSEDDEDSEDDSSFTLLHAEQVHRARLAKLTRHLGEEIPADMVLSPAFLSRGTSTYSLPRRGGRSHQRRRSLDLSAFLHNPPVGDSRGANVKRSKSLKGHGEPIPPLPTNFPHELAANSLTIEREKGCSNASNNTEAAGSAAPNPPQPIPSSTLENRSEVTGNDLAHQSSSRERASMDTYSESPSTLPSIESSETSHSSPRPSPRTRTLPRRPATTPASRRVEKLANFFGVDHDDLHAIPQLHRATQKVQSSSAGDLAIDIHPTNPRFGVDVRISKPNRFWNLIGGGATTKTVHPDDVMNELRTMKAS